MLATRQICWWGLPGFARRQAAGTPDSAAGTCAALDEGPRHASCGSQRRQVPQVQAVEKLSVEQVVQSFEQNPDRVVACRVCCDTGGLQVV